MYDREIVYDDVILRLKAAARANLSVEAAQIQLVNLNDIIARTGRHWPLVQERIRYGAAEFLRGWLEADDIVIPCGDGFLLIFAHGDAEGLSARCAELQTLLNLFFIGEEGLEELRADVRRRPMAPEALKALIAADIAVTDWAETERHQIVFAPAWSPRAEAIACHICGPTYCERGIVRFGHDGAYRRIGRHGGEHFAALDSAMLDIAAAAALRDASEDRPGIICVSVHASTLRRQGTRQAYFTQLSAIPNAALQRLTIKVAEIEPGAPSWTLAEWASLLRRHVRHVAFELHHSERRLERLADAGAWAVCVQLPTHARNAPLETQRDLRNLIRLWAQAAARLKTRLLIDQARSGPLLSMAKAAGVDFVTSDVFWPARAAPGDSAPDSASWGLAAPPDAAATARYDAV